MLVGRILFLTGCWTKGLGSSLAVGQRLPSVLCHTGLSPQGSSQHGSCLPWEQASERAREAEQEGSQSFSVTQYKNEHAPNNILFIRSKSLSPAHTQRRRIHKGEYLKMRITGNHCRIYPPHIHWVLWLDMGYCQCVYSLISVHSQEPLYCLPGDSIHCWMSFSGGNQECWLNGELQVGTRICCSIGKWFPSRKYHKLGVLQ